MEHLTNAELAIMRCLWMKSPLSCAEIMEASDDVAKNRNAVSTTIKSLNSKGYLSVYDRRGNGRHQFNRYVPMISSSKYMASILENNPVYRQEMLPSIVSCLVSKVKNKKTLEKIKAVIEAAYFED